MSELPGGTVTLVFTDIEGSTRLLASLGSRYEEVLGAHRRLLRETLSSYGGMEVDTQGDALFYAFSRAQEAVAGSVVAQRALGSNDFGEGVELRVRMGIHTGEPTVSDEGYVGSDVHLGARICAAAWGEQILISDATARLLRDSKQASLRDLGEHVLKDIETPLRLHQVIASGLRTDFPPPRTVSSNPTNLPLSLDPLVGRAEDISELTSLLASPEARVVTLTGPGGVGKTRLSLAAGAELLPSFDEGVFFVDLSALIDPALVVGAIAGTLGLRESAGRSLTETVSDYLASRQVLLILDNLEHLLDATPDISSLVSSAPELKVLVTSREPLRIAGEHEVPLAPLGLPSEDLDPSEVLSSPAVELFAERARALRPGFELTRDDASSVAAICRGVDGLPLAIELAAARTKVLSLSALASRLDQSLDTLGQGRRDASDRQRTLLGAIAWSYELLTPNEQTLFRRLGVFAGGFTLEAAEQVCDQGELDLDVLDGLSSLVDKSLVRTLEGDEDRFSILETIREFASERLEESGEGNDIRRAHGEFFRRIAEQAWSGRAGSRQVATLRELRREQPNFRAVLRWAITAELEIALALASYLWHFWRIEGQLTEGRKWLELSLERPDAVPDARARALRGLSVIAELQRDPAAARGAAREAMRLFDELHDQGGIARCMETLAGLSQEDGDLDGAITLYTRIKEICGKLGDELGVAAALGNLAHVALLREDYESALELEGASKRLYERHGDAEGTASSLINQGLALLGSDSPSRSKAPFRDALALAAELHHRHLSSVALEGLAAEAAAAGDYNRAARLLGAASRRRSEEPHSRDSLEERVYARAMRLVQEGVDDRQLDVLFDEGWASGQSIMISEASA